MFRPILFAVECKDRGGPRRFRRGNNGPASATGRIGIEALFKPELPNKLRKIEQIRAFGVGSVFVPGSFCMGQLQRVLGSVLIRNGFCASLRMTKIGKHRGPDMVCGAFRSFLRLGHGLGLRRKTIFTTRSGSSRFQRNRAGQSLSSSASFGRKRQTLLNELRISSPQLSRKTKRRYVQSTLQATI